MASKTPRISVLGSLNIDLVSYVPHHPLPGETLTSTSFAVSPGGKGANQAVACAKLSRTRAAAAAASSSSSSGDPPSAAGAGASAAAATAPAAEVGMAGCVGADSYGALLRENMASHGVDVSGVQVRDGLKTGVAVIIVDEPTGQNRIVLSPEANHAFGPADFADEASLLRALGGERPDLLIMQLEIPIDAVLQALETAKTAGVPVLLNPAPAVKLPVTALRGLTHLVVNETEAAILGGCAESELESEAGLERLAREFIDTGVGNVVITLGGRGVYYMAASGAKGFAPALKAKVVDTTAAGDTFVGQYALETASGSGFDIAKAISKSNRAAAKTVEKLGAQISIPWMDEVE